MTDSRLRLLLQFLTNILAGGVISAAWLTGKIDAATALIPLLALAGLDMMGRKAEAKAETANNAINASSGSLPPPSGPTSPSLRGTIPPAGPAALGLAVALQTLLQMLT